MPEIKSIWFAGICLLALTSATSAAQWVQTWGAAPLPPTPARGPFPATPSFENQTIRQTLRVSLGGPRIRIRFTNEYGAHALRIGAARVALADEQGNVQPGTARQIRFSGQPTASIPAGAPFLSDPIDLTVKPLGSLSISLFLPEATGQCTCHEVGMQNALVSDTGDFTDKAFRPKKTLQRRAFLSGVEVELPEGGRALVVLGDSISDGVGSTPDANHRWPDQLANRLDAQGSSGWGVVNMGISGNQVLSDGAGQSALARFDRDVLSVPGATVVIVFEGVNDLGMGFGRSEGPLAELFRNRPPAPSEQSMVAGYRQLIARAHAKGLRILGTTLIPYEGAFYYSEKGEAIRTALNTWIRSSHEFDGVIDFDAVMRDPAQPTRMKHDFDSGDHLHGSDAGYAAMAAAFDLSILK